MMNMRYLILLAPLALSAQLVEGPGMTETDKNCKACHEIERSISLRQDINGWNNTIAKMVGFGMKSKESDLAIVAEYLAKHYPADAMPPINVNTASAIELESRFSLKRSQSSAFLAHREKVGKLKTFADLKKSPGMDPERIEAKKAQIVF
ncbi:MAG: helix-hairpin-helix domain-containing protein [Acidobacteria bacterium]|nr:helix-hairpin-helix domain-containing protein [Acidobacteriota bacterium]